MKTSKNQAVMLINVAIMIDENDPVFKMAEIREKLDYRKLHSSYRRRWRKIDPEVMFSIVVYANMQGIFSSRAIYRRSVQNRHQVYVAAANMT